MAIARKDDAQLTAPFAHAQPLMSSLDRHYKMLPTCKNMRPCLVAHLSYCWSKHWTFQLMTSFS
eukprot:1148571-Pelagomonas_calceolata.AAC.8